MSPVSRIGRSHTLTLCNLARSHARRTQRKTDADERPTVMTCFNLSGQKRLWAIPSRSIVRHFGANPRGRSKLAELYGILDAKAGRITGDRVGRAITRGPDPFQ